MPGMFFNGEFLLLNAATDYRLSRSKTVLKTPTPQWILKSS